MRKSLVLATRRSPLAMRQADLVARTIGEKTGQEVVLLPMLTTGDRQSQWSLEKSGGKGLFTKELELALLEGRADLAVHSAKDMPTEMPDGLGLVAFLPREDPVDIFVCKEGVVRPTIIASGSPRRRAQATKLFPEAKWIELRGNVETRLKKIAQGEEAEATLLAAAGLKRLKIEHFPGLSFRPLNLEEMVPAPGQGAIAIQAAVEHKKDYAEINDGPTEKAVSIERAVLTAFGGGCQVALGANYCSSTERLSFFHEKCGIKSLCIAGREQTDWMNELIGWTKSK
ncbi:MAG: hydroxymethylbilane synthase [Opitutae bacterium]